MLCTQLFTFQREKYYKLPKNDIARSLLRYLDSPKNLYLPNRNTNAPAHHP